MRKTMAIASLLMLLISSSAFADGSNRFDPGLRMLQAGLVHKDKALRAGDLSDFSRHYSVFSHPGTGQTSVGVFIRLKDLSAVERVRAAGAEVHTVLPSGIITAWAPVSMLDKFSAMDEIVYVRLSAKSRPLMDVSRPEIRADLVQQGSGLPQPYEGNGVVVGIVDSGIDLTHPDFKNEGATRIAYLWDQTHEGKPPAGYTYGNESTSWQINSGFCDETDVEGHGTHVAGTAAGNGQAPNKTADYTGIAPKADIIFVKTGFEDDQTIDAVKYIFSRAQELGRPAVINLSLGGNYGPHDGTSLYCSAMSELTGKGRIIVAAAGNSGSDNVHLGYEVDHEGSSSLFGPNPESEIVFDVWYSSEYLMDIKVAQVDSVTLEIIEETDWVVPGERIHGEFESKDELEIDAREVENPQNGDRHAMIELELKDPGSSLWALRFRAHESGKTAVFDCWVVSDAMGAFVNDKPGYVNADSLKTVESPAVARDVIAVGAYNTKNKWTDIDMMMIVRGDTIGARADFSSIGPTRDGRTKPEITAPGQYIASAYSVAFVDPSQHYERDHRIWGDYYYIMRGTSMACPHVAGVVALMLQRDAGLHPAKVLSLLTGTARTDSYTRSNGDLPNNYWGYGKVDALAVMKALMVTDSDSDDGGCFIRAVAR